MSSVKYDLTQQRNKIHALCLSESENAFQEKLLIINFKKMFGGIFIPTASKSIFVMVLIYHNTKEFQYMWVCFLINLKCVCYYNTYKNML